MIDEATLSANVLQFAGKSFDFDRTLELGGTEYALFGRTETDTEAKLRPELVRMKVVVPRAWVVYEEAMDLLVLVPPGASGPARRRAAGATQLEPAEFRDQGIDWVREPSKEGGHLYVPKEERDRLLSAGGRSALGV